MDNRVGIRLSSHWMGGRKARLRRKEYPLDTRMDRRAFLKNAALAGAALMVAPVALGAAEPKKALADTASGTMTANVWVKPTGLPAAAIGSGNVAYLTNDTTPTGLTGPFPTSPVEDNATYEDDGTTLTVTIPLVNTMFTLTDITDWTSGGMTIEQEATEAYNDGSRYTALVVTVPSGTTGTFQFAAKEYAGFSFFAGTKSWPINIVL